MDDAGPEKGYRGLLKEKMGKVAREMIRELRPHVIEGSQELTKMNLGQFGIALYSQEGLHYLSGQYEGDLKDSTEVARVVREKIVALEDKSEDHETAMFKARAYGHKGHEVICGIAMNKRQIDGQPVTILHYPDELTDSEAIHVLKQAALSS